MKINKKIKCMCNNCKLSDSKDCPKEKLDEENTKLLKETLREDTRDIKSGLMIAY